MIYIDSKNTVTFYDAPEIIETAIHNLLMRIDEVDVGVGYDGELTRPAYEQGLTDAWELAKKIAIPTRTQHDAFTAQDLNNIFGARGYENVMSKFSASEAIAKVQACEEQKKAEAEIKVGDEVYFSDKNHTRVVFSIFYENAKEPRVLQFTESGNYVVDNISDLHKTGRHFSQIEEVLKQMKGE